MDFNFLGVAFVDDGLPKETTRIVEDKMEELHEKVREEFGSWLSQNGLEQVMGIVIEKSRN